MVFESVLVRWASLTALPQGPSVSNRHNRPVRSIACPEALKIYVDPASATAIRNGGFALLRSTTVTGKPLCRDTMLHTSTAALIEVSAPSSTARRRYSDAGLLRPAGL